MREIDSSTPYDRAFYQEQQERSLLSAKTVLPIVLSLTKPASIVDVGCGVGPWAAAACANGVSDVTGIDGEYVDREMLLIPTENFCVRDLAAPLGLNRTFDLAICLEVAEHLPESRGPGLIADLTTLAPAVLFSAAIPGQGGTAHINEQYVSYWAQLFEDRQYVACDLVRRHVWLNPDVDWWYQQNTILFVRSGHPLASRSVPASSLDHIHPILYDRWRRDCIQRETKLSFTENPSVGTVLRSLPAALRRWQQPAK